MEILQSGQMLGPYRIISKIGQGGMASVYKAYQASIDRNVAIKVLPGQLAETVEFAKRFQQEARTIARLEHPHILPIIDFGEDNGITYFVMRYLEGGTLKSKMEAGPLSLNDVDRIFSQLCDALGYAHAHGVVHRDLKPANALVDESGNLFLTDFGIAKILESASPRLTQTDAIMGTPAYISPEQAQAQTVDQRSDIYSLGIILFEMVTGRVPFLADTPLAVILKHLNDPLPLPSVIKADIPDAIEKVILKALAKSREDRFNNTSEFLSAWKRALREVETVRVEPVAAPRPVVSAPVSQPQPQITYTTAPAATNGGASKSILIGCGALLCIALVVGGFFFTASRMNNPTVTRAPTRTLIPTTGVIQPSSTVALLPVLPIATETPAEPTATAIPEFTATSILQYFTEDFDNDPAWDFFLTSGDESKINVEFSNSRMIFTLDDLNIYAYYIYEGFEYDDVTVQVRAENRGRNNNNVSLICRMSDEGWYEFSTEGGGVWYLYAVAPGSDGYLKYNIIANGGAKSLKQGQETNDYSMTCQGDEIRLAINGVDVRTVSEGTYAFRRGQVGINISSLNVVPIIVEVDWFKISEP